MRQDRPSRTTQRRRRAKDVVVAHHGAVHWCISSKSLCLISIQLYRESGRSDRRLPCAIRSEAPGATASSNRPGSSRYTFFLWCDGIHVSPANCTSSATASHWAAPPCTKSVIHSSGSSRSHGVVAFRALRHDKLVNAPSAYRYCICAAASIVDNQKSCALALADGGRLEKSRAQRIVWLMEELKLKYELQVYRRNKDMFAPQELKDIHPLGKSPVIGVQSSTQAKPTAIAESAFIVEYLCEYFGIHLIPRRYKAGKEGMFGEETEEWLRYRFFMHYAEGSLMGLLVMMLVMYNVEEAPLPFFLKPIPRAVANGVKTQYLNPNLSLHFAFLEEQIRTSPGGGQFLCGTQLTGADIMMSYPLESAIGRAGLTEQKYPRLYAFIQRMKQRPAYLKAVQRIIDETGEYDPNLIPEPKTK
ncbi:hypothetical protein MRB53_038660 [Persea americana]|nr:hypothetical protein MRB53_038660 [Persea americana]